MVSLVSFIILFLLSNVISIPHKKHILTKKNPLPKKLKQHAYYYSIKNAIHSGISYEKSHNYLYNTRNR